MEEPKDAAAISTDSATAVVQEAEMVAAVAAGVGHVRAVPVRLRLRRWASHIL